VSGASHGRFVDMPALSKLSELPVGTQALVREFPKQGSAFLRLREMGLMPGTPVTLVRTAPLGDPIEVKVRGYNLTLRKSEAEHILVETTAPAKP
jgi:ferrous iron transport protein A